MSPRAGSRSRGPWTAAFYGHARGELEGFASASAEGTLAEGADGRALSAALGRHPRRVTVKLAGLGRLHQTVETAGRLEAGP